MDTQLAVILPSQSHANIYVFRSFFMDVLDSISKIIADVLDEEDLLITRDTTAEDVEDWDSLAQIQIIAAIEKELNIKFSLQEIQQLNQANTVGCTVDLISQKLGAA